METIINGISQIKTSEYSILIFEEFTPEVEASFKQYLVPICYGAKKAASKRLSYSYETTIKELVKRYDKKTLKQKKGLVGELLFHYAIDSFYSEFSINSPYFNLEERNVKKGFDAILNNTKDMELWIAEVKSGEVNKKSSPAKAVVSLINTAKRDLIKRLPQKDDTLWQNAINGVEVAMMNTNTDKDAFIDLLSSYSDQSIQGNNKSTDFNVILVGNIFGELSNPIDEILIKKVAQEIIKQNKFKKSLIFAIQKEIYQSVIQFLKKEASCD